MGKEVRVRGRQAEFRPAGFGVGERFGIRPVEIDRAAKGRVAELARRRRGVRASVVARTGPRAPNRRGFFLFREELHFFQRTTMENARAGRRERTDASGPTFLRQSLASSTAGPHSRPSIFAALTAATVAADPDPNVDVDCDGCSTRGIQEDVSMARCRSDGRSTSERHAIGECRVRRCERA